MNATSTRPATIHEVARATCWRCRAAVADDADSCPACGAVQPPRALDHFARLGLPRAFALDLKALERRYFDGQRRFHPDRFTGRSAEERALALRHATALNEAYEHLKSPLRRAVYLLGLLDAAYRIDESATEKDSALLMDALERREALADASDVGTVDGLAAEARRDADACLLDIERHFASLDLAKAERAVARLKYLTKYAEDARDRRRRLAEGASS